MTFAELATEIHEATETEGNALEWRTHCLAMLKAQLFNNKEAADHFEHRMQETFAAAVQDANGRAYKA